MRNQPHRDYGEGVDSPLPYPLIENGKAHTSADSAGNTYQPTSEPDGRHRPVCRVRQGSILCFKNCCSQCHLLFQLGCGGGGGERPDLGYVEGTVTMDGTPLANVVLTFQPDHARPAYGRTDDQGWYELVYTEGNPGATIGPHSVRISSADANSEDGGNYEDGEGDGKSRGEKIPSKYTQGGELTADVKAGNNVFDFDLTSGDG